MAKQKLTFKMSWKGKKTTECDAVSPLLKSVCKVASSLSPHLIRASADLFASIAQKLLIIERLQMYYSFVWWETVYTITQRAHIQPTRCEKI